MSVNISLACGDLTAKACSVGVTQALKPIFMFMGILLLVAVIIHIIFITVKVRDKKVVYWVGIVLFDFLLVFMAWLTYLLFPWFLRVFGIIKVT